MLVQLAYIIANLDRITNVLFLKRRLSFFQRLIFFHWHSSLAIRGWLLFYVSIRNCIFPTANSILRINSRNHVRLCHMRAIRNTEYSWISFWVVLLENASVFLYSLFDHWSSDRFILLNIIAHGREKGILWLLNYLKMWNDLSLSLLILWCVNLHWYRCPEYVRMLSVAYFSLPILRSVDLHR